MALAILLSGRADAQGVMDMSDLSDVSEVVVVDEPASPPPPAQKAEPPKSNLAPEVQKKIDEILGKVKDKKGDLWTSNMKREIDDIAKTTGIKDDAVQALTTASQQAVTASLQTWSPKLPAMALRGISTIPKDQALAMLSQAEMQIGMMAQSNFTGDVVAPEDQDVWIKALHQALTPAQFDTWTQSRDKIKADAEKQIAGILKDGEDRMRTQQTSEVVAECKNIELALKLPKDRADKLDELGKSVVDQTVKLWRDREEKFLLAMTEEQRRPLMNQHWSMGEDPSESPTALPAWKDGVVKLLSADELAQLQNGKDARKAKRVHVMGQVMVMLLDEKIALTDAQRQKLQPIADRLVKDVPELYPDNAPGTYYSFNSDVFYQATTKATDAELKPILDATQLKRWQDLSKPDAMSGPRAMAMNVPPPPTNTQPEDVERAVSSYFYDKTEKERKRSLAANTLKAEDIARVAGLNAETSERLQAAARGATEQYLTTWKWFTEQQIRSQLQDLTPQNVRQRLDGIQEFFFQRNIVTSSTRDSIWDETVETVLNAQQQGAWKKETDARQAFRGNAIASLVLCEFDRRTHLTEDQWTKLQPMLAGVVNDYSQGITQVFGGMNNSPWYMGGPYVLIPFAGVDEKDLGDILTKEQMDVWKSSQDFANATNIWQVVKQFHAQRARQNVRGAIIED